MEVAVALWQILDSEYCASVRSIVLMSLYLAALELMQTKFVSNLISLMKLYWSSSAGFWCQSSAYRGLFWLTFNGKSDKTQGGGVQCWREVRVLLEEQPWSGVSQCPPCFC